VHPIESVGGQATQAATIAAPSASPSTTRVLLTSAEAARLIFGVSERKFHEMRSLPWMPQPRVLGPRLVRWVRDELEHAARNIPSDAAAPAEPPQLRRARIEAMKCAGVAAQ
jgi:hypothetical protein